MKSKIYVSILSLLLTAAVLLTGAQTALADATDTTAGTSVSNLATLNYTLTSGGSFVLESGSDPVLGNSTPGVGQGTATTFLVDNKVRPYVEVVAANTNADIFAGGTGQWIAFNVKNYGNKDGDFRITYEIADTVVTQNPLMYYEAGANGSYDGGEAAIPGSGVISIARDATVTVYVVAETLVPSTALSEGDFETYNLIATAWDTGAGLALAEDGDGDDAAAEEVVWVDDAGTATGDAAFGGFHSDAGTFTFRNVQLTMTKTEAIVVDPYGLGYHLPGVYVQYTIVVENTSTGASSAYLTTMDDVITAAAGSYSFDSDHVVDVAGTPANAAGDSVHVVLGGTTRAATDFWLTGTGADSDPAAVAGNTLSLTFDDTGSPTPVLLPDTDAGYGFGELKQNETITITYNVKISGTDATTVP